MANYQGMRIYNFCKSTNSAGCDYCDTKPECPSDFNPNITSDNEKNYIIQKFSGQYLLQMAKVEDLEISNNLYQTYKYTPFIELLYPYYSDTNYTYYHVYASELVENQFNTNQAAQLDLSSEPDDMIVNENKILMMDLNIQQFKKQEDIYPLPLYKYYSFKDNIDIKIKYKYFANLSVPKIGGPYTENFIYRNNTFVYYPKTFAYFLISSKTETQNLKIYIMQVFSTLVNKTITPQQLTLFPEYPVENGLVLPSGWLFAYMQLSDFITIQSLGQATVISDNLYNSYMYIYPETNKWLYDKYK